jgi:putative GTP pyrophosphokinase
MTTRAELEKSYSERYQRGLEPLADALQHLLDDLVKGKFPRVDRISARAKSIERFLDKAFKVEEGKLKYADPMNEITDQVGARIVTLYVNDVEKVRQIILEYFGAIEELEIKPSEANQFDYEGRHFTLFIPEDVKTNIPKEFCPKFFELQIKTVFQHAWGEANHDLAYKPKAKPTRDQLRFVAYTAAQAWGADQIFNQLAAELLGRE